MISEKNNVGDHSTLITTIEALFRKKGTKTFKRKFFIKDRNKSRDSDRHFFSLAENRNNFFKGDSSNWSNK